jgi:hypothetical protein
MHLTLVRDAGYQPWMLSGPAYFPVMATGLSGIEHTLSAVVQNEDFPAS